MQHGMIWTGLPDLPGGADGVNRLGSHAGAMGQAGQEPPDVAPNAEDLRTGARLGERVATAVARWRIV